MRRMEDEKLNGMVKGAEERCMFVMISGMFPEPDASQGLMLLILRTRRKSIYRCVSFHVIDVIVHDGSFYIILSNK